MQKLTSIDIGSTVKVEELLSTGYVRERMLALGLTKGASIAVVRRGPNNNLTVYNIRGAMIALRKEESENIIVSHI
ncbi:FeoA family protein [Romboutsia sp.]|uniref:FeoA family protein n=1 Tax=Romboutsia sp. TaxID=1965302 RepID=UPI003F2F15DE